MSVSKHIQEVIQDSSNGLHQKSSFENIIFHMYVFQTTQTNTQTQSCSSGRGARERKNEIERENLHF